MAAPRNVTTTPTLNVGMSMSLSGYKEMIALANIDPQNLDRFFTAIAPAVRTKEREFLVLNTSARELVVGAFTDFVERGELSRRTEYRINKLLAKAPFSGELQLDGQDVHSVARVRAPMMAHMCAYGIACLILNQLTDNIRRCPLAECREFFWASVKGTRRASYCCEAHRIRGAKRASRETKRSKRTTR